jgi:hypothetical protein
MFHLFVVLSVVMLSGIMSVAMVNVIMLSVAMLKVVVPIQQPTKKKKFAHFEMKILAIK